MSVPQVTAVHEVKRQSELTLNLYDPQRPDESVAWLRRHLVWRRPLDQRGAPIGPLPGIAELDGWRRVALLNDLQAAQVTVQMRLNKEALVLLTGDPDADRLTHLGPHPLAASDTTRNFAPVPYTITTQWQDYPAVVAAWFQYEAEQDRRLGAEYREDVFEKQLSPSGETVSARRTRIVPHIRDRMRLATGAPAHLIEWRGPGEVAATERPSGLVLPSVPDQRDQQIADLEAKLARQEALLERVLSRLAPDEPPAADTVDVGDVDVTTAAPVTKARPRK